MKHSSELFVDASPEEVVEVLSDLSTYPAWNDLVASAEPVERIDGDFGPAWSTTLKAKVGPFSRSKQLRFVRDLFESDESVGKANICFSRRELDGRNHASWKMECSVSGATNDETAVTLTLTYDGGLWVPSLGTVLDGAIRRATTRLPAYVVAQQ